MNLLDIIGPIMVGPSSSHTAGAVRIGYIANKLMGEKIKEAAIYLHGSFESTGKGHGTDRALVGGLLGMKADDMRIPESFDVAVKEGLIYTFDKIALKDAHPNSVLLRLKGMNGRMLELVASSIGGGRIKVCQIDGLDANFSGEYPTLVVHNLDQPGHISEVTSMLSHKRVNIATMQLYRAERGGQAVMVIECDEEVPKEGIEWLKNLEGVNKVTYLSLKENESHIS